MTIITQSSPPPDGGFLIVPRLGTNGAFEDFEVVEVHGAVAKLLRRSADQLVGQPLRVIFPIPRVEEFIASFRQVLASGQPQELEYPILFGAIDATWIWQRATPEGNAIRVEIRDLSAQRRAEVRQAAADHQFEILFQHSPLPILLHGPDGRISDANASFATLVGGSRQEIESRYIQSLLDAPIDAGEATAPVRRLLRLNDGSHHPVLLHIDELPHGYRLIAVRDVSASEELERVRADADAARRESEARFRSAFDEAGIGMALVTRDGQNSRVNKALCEMLGYSEAELLAMNSREVIHPDDVGASLLNWERFDRGEVTSTRSEKRYFRRDGTLIWAQLTLSLVHDDASQPRYFLAQIEDITERWRLTQALADSEARFRSSFEEAGVGMALLSPTGATLSANAALATMLGYDIAAVQALQWRDILHPEAHESAGANLARVARGEINSNTMERRGLRSDGSTIWMQVTVSAVRAGSGLPIYLLGQLEDITERKRLSAALRDSEEQLRLALEVTRDSIWDWRIPERSYAAPTFRAMLGFPPDDGFGQADLLALVHPEDRQRLLETQNRHISVPQHDPYDIEFRMQRADGNYAWIRSRGQVVERDAQGQALRMIGTHADVSERRILEEQFRQAQKMEAVGKLAGGVAHDFNNLLTTITAITELLLQDLAEGNPHRNDVLDIALAADRAKTLTRQLLSFSRQEVERLAVVEIDAVVQRVRPLLHRLVALGQQLVVECTAPTVWVDCDPSQFELGLMNLVANARDAMPHGGTVTVRTQSVVLDSEELSQLPQLAPGRYLTVCVQDTGVGMTEEVLRHLFEPFFTTKPQGKGTGLGLAIIYGFIERMHGAVTVKSVPDVGSAFTLYLPTVDAPHVRPGTAASLVQTARPDQQRRVLVVDDETTLRRTTRRLLERKGYEVLEAANADEALAALETAPEGSIHIILTDQAMPGRTGRQLLQEVSLRYPGIRSILMSGYTGDQTVREELSESSTTFLAKPFTIQELTSALKS